MAVESWRLGGPLYPAEESTYEVASPPSACFSSLGNQGIHSVQLAPEVVLLVGL